MSKETNTERDEAVAQMESAPDGEAAERAEAKNLKKDHDGASVSMEGTAPGTRPSRKSTRRSSNHVKPDSALHQKAVSRTRSPTHRHVMRGN